MYYTFISVSYINKCIIIEDSNSGYMSAKNSNPFKIYMYFNGSNHFVKKINNNFDNYNNIDTNTIIKDNNGVAVMIDASHNCVQCRGVKHGGASMKTSKLTGAFKDDASTRAEYYEFIKGYKS